MRHIATSADQVDTIKKLAKRLQRNGGGKHADLLDRVARQHGYLHWHHVTLCAKTSAAEAVGSALIAEIRAIADAELTGKIKVVMTGPESSGSQPFVLISTGVGDAWLLDPHENLAASVVWRGERRASPARVNGDDLEILWDGRFELLGQFFRVDADDTDIGTHAIAGYPLEALRDALERARTVDQRIHAIFDQPDAIALTEPLIGQLVQHGWSETQVRDAAAAGGRYSPSRGSILLPPQAGHFDPDEPDPSDGIDRP
jgi:hypothetical protein